MEAKKPTEVLAELADSGVRLSISDKGKLSARREDGPLSHLEKAKIRSYGKALRQLCEWNEGTAQKIKTKMVEAVWKEFEPLSFKQLDDFPERYDKAAASVAVFEVKAEKAWDEKDMFSLRMAARDYVRAGRRHTPKRETVSA